MDLPIVLRPEAEADLAGAVEWYESVAPGLGAEFLRAAEAVIAQVRRTPAPYPVVSHSARRAIPRRFPYLLIDREILVIACMHAHRDPRLWRRRLRV